MNYLRAPHSSALAGLLGLALLAIGCGLETRAAESAGKSAVPPSRPRFETWIAALRGTTVARCGPVATQPFCALQAKITDVATDLEIEMLLGSEIPEARIAALSSLTLEPRVAEPRLLQHVCDGGPLYCPGVPDASVGVLARVLLQQPNALQGQGRSDSLLSSRELEHLDWTILARDDCARTRALSALYVGCSAMGIAARNLTLEVLRAELYGLSEEEILKAGARAVMNTPSECEDARGRYREYLTVLAEASTGAPRTRLAAMSALTRLGTLATLRRLEVVKASLGALEPAGVAEGLLSSLRRRLSFEAEVRSMAATNHRAVSDCSIESPMGTLLLSLDDEPFVLDWSIANCQSLDEQQRHGSPSCLAGVLIRLSDSADRGLPDWSIDSDLPERLQGAAARLLGHDFLKARIEAAASRSRGAAADIPGRAQVRRDQ